MTRVVSLCAHNDARSQIAEGFLRALGRDRFDAVSAGTVATSVHPFAVRVMREVGIDIAAQRSKSVDELAGPFDACVTVCDASCPIPPRAGIELRWRGADPAPARGSEAERPPPVPGRRAGGPRRGHRTGSPTGPDPPA